MTLFDKFTGLGMEDIKFAEFLRVFQNELRHVKRNEKGLLFDEIDKNSGTKDKQVILDKLDMLESLLLEFLRMDNQRICDSSVERFIAENLDMNIEIVKFDMDFYRESLSELLEKTVRIDSKLRNAQNRPSLLAMMAYSYQQDRDLDEWMADYAKKNNTYFADQKQNYLYMKRDFAQYCRRTKINCKTI